MSTMSSPFSSPGSTSRGVISEGPHNLMRSGEIYVVVSTTPGAVPIIEPPEAFRHNLQYSFFIPSQTGEPKRFISGTLFAYRPGPSGGLHPQVEIEEIAPFARTHQDWQNYTHMICRMERPRSAGRVDLIKIRAAIGTAGIELETSREWFMRVTRLLKESGVLARAPTQPPTDKFVLWLERTAGEHPDISYVFEVSELSDKPASTEKKKCSVM